MARDSIGGVINIITAAPPQQSAATIATGSFDQQNYLFSTPYLTFARTYAANDYPVVDGPNRQNAQAGSTSLTARYGHSIGAIDLTLSGDIGDAYAGAPGELGYYSPTSEQANVNRNVRLNAEHRGARSTTSLTLGDSSQDLSYTCNTPVDSNCPNSYYPTPAPGASSNPPYAQDALRSALDGEPAQRRRRRARAARLRYRRDARRRPDRSRNRRRFAACGRRRPIFDPYAQTAAYVQSQWFGPRGQQIYVGLRGERDGGIGAHTRRRSAACFRSRPACNSSSMRRLHFARRPRKSSTIPVTPIRISHPNARASAT